MTSAMRRATIVCGSRAAGCRPSVIDRRLDAAVTVAHLNLSDAGPGCPGGIQVRQRPPFKRIVR